MNDVVLMLDEVHDVTLKEWKCLPGLQNVGSFRHALAATEKTGRQRQTAMQKPQGGSHDEKHKSIIHLSPPSETARTKHEFTAAWVRRLSGGFGIGLFASQREAGEAA